MLTVPTIEVRSMPPAQSQYWVSHGLVTSSPRFMNFETQGFQNANYLPASQARLPLLKQSQSFVDGHILHDTARGVISQKPL